MRGYLARTLVFQVWDFDSSRTQDAMDEPELARRVGVPVEFVERLVGFGILKPDDDGKFSRGDLFRIQLMRSSESAGVPLEGIAQAIEEGRFTLSFLDMPHYRWSTLQGKTFADLAQESDIPLDY